MRALNEIQVTLSENVHKFAELSQRIVVEKSVIQKYEEEMITRDNIIKSTTEICVENHSRVVSSTSSTSTKDIANTNGILNGDIEESDQQTTVEEEADEMVDNDGATLTTKASSKVTLSKIMTKSDGRETKSNANTPDSNKASDFLSHFTKTPTNKVTAPEVTVQRPIKPQSEMDFAVPYNIINNYFSVGVVSRWVFMLIRLHFA